MNRRPVISRSRTGIGNPGCQIAGNANPANAASLQAIVRIHRNLLLDAWLQILQQAVRREHAGQRADRLRALADELQAAAYRVQLRRVA